VCIRVTPFTDLEFNSMTLSFKISDKRFIRGMYNANSAST
jgi:hypothetical protein